jgi:urease accessory protein
VNLSALLSAAQYADSAYPAGGFAQSWGLESAVTERHATGAAGVEALCLTLLRHQAGPADAVAAAACSRLVGGGLDTFAAIDRRLSAARAAREARLASERMGRRLIETAAAAEDDRWLMALRDAVAVGATPGNYASVLGAICGRAGMEPEVAAALALWTTANGVLAAALRLLPFTHDDLQAALVRLRASIAALASEAAAATPDEIAGGAPQLEIWSMRHETAEARLFSS